MFFLHSEVCTTQRNFWAEALCNKDGVTNKTATHKGFYSQTFLHAETFTHGSSYTILTQNNFLHGADFTQRSSDFTHRHLYHSSLYADLFYA